MQITARKPANLVELFQQITSFSKKSHSVKSKHKQITETFKICNFVKNALFNRFPFHNQPPGKKTSLFGTKKDIRFSAFWIQLHMVPVKHQLFKNSEKGVKTGNPYTYSDQSGILFYTKMEHWFPFERNSHR